MTLTLPNNGNLYLCGFMGAGKTTVGPIIARELGISFVDTDRSVVVLSGKSIPVLFEKDGEEAFRKWEERAIEQVSRMRGHVVALGGGSLMNPESLKRIKSSGMLVYLKGTIPELMKRIIASDRPKLKNLDTDELPAYLEDLLRDREPVYAKSDLIIDTDGMSTGDVAREILKGVSTWKR